jgi:hypothetical protein
MPWYVLVTQPRSELKVKVRLRNIGIEVSCPALIERRQWSDRVKKVTQPLLPPMVLVSCIGASKSCEYKVDYEKPKAVKHKAKNKK